MINAGMRIIQSRHPLKIAYVELGARLAYQLVATTLLLRAISKSDFAEYSFGLMVTTYVAVVINATFDSLINRDFSETGVDDSEFYRQSFKVKLAAFLAAAVAIVLLVDVHLAWLVLIACIVGITIVTEHQDVQLRYRRDYRSYPARIVLLLATAIPKLYFCTQAMVSALLAMSIFELLAVAWINRGYVAIGSRPGDELAFLRANGRDLLKSFSSAFLIFSFFRIDQFVVYTQLGRPSFANYVLAVRFNELANNIVGVLARYRIPSVFSGDVSARRSMAQLMVAQVLVGTGLLLGLHLYVAYLVPAYAQAIPIFPVLVVGGLFLIFGQIRGVIFVKEKLLVPDIINAAMGIATFFGTFMLVRASTGMDVALCYLASFVVSGFVSTLFYSRGRLFMRHLLGR